MPQMLFFRNKEGLRLKLKLSGLNWKDWHAYVLCFKPRWMAKLSNGEMEIASGKTA